MTAEGSREGSRSSSAAPPAAPSPCPAPSSPPPHHHQQPVTHFCTSHHRWLVQGRACPIGRPPVRSQRGCPVVPAHTCSVSCQLMLPADAAQCSWCRTGTKEDLLMDRDPHASLASYSRIPMSHLPAGLSAHPARWRMGLWVQALLALFAGLGGAGSASAAPVSTRHAAAHASAGKLLGSSALPTCQAAAAPSGKLQCHGGDWLSIIAALGVGFRPARSRADSRSFACTRSQVPSRRNW